MFTIAEFSDRIGEFICQKAEMEAEVKKVCHGVECLLVIVISFTLISLIGYFFGVLKETIIIQTAALVMKNIIGGAHLSGFLRCTGFSAVLLVGVAVAERYTQFGYSWWMIIILLLLGVLAIYFFAPKETKALTVHQIQKRKYLAFFLMILAGLINILSNEFWSRYVLLGFMVSIFLISPIGNQLAEWVEYITKRKGD